VSGLRRLCQENGGFTLLEVLVASTILAIGVMGFMALQSTSIASRSFAKEMSRNTVAGAGMLDEILLSDFSSADLVAGDHTATRTIGGQPITFNWKVYDRCPSEFTKLVLITLQWNEKGKPRSLTLTQVKGMW